MFTVRSNNGIGLTLTDGNYAIDLPSGAVGELNKYFLESIGLWRDEETGYFVTRHRDLDGDFLVLKFKDSPEINWRSTVEDQEDSQQEALNRYIATQPSEFKPGEVWEIVLESGEKLRAVPYESCDGSIQFSSSKGVFLTEDIRFLRRRLLITTEGEYVG